MKVLRGILIGTIAAAIVLLGIAQYYESQAPPHVDKELTKYVETWKQACDQRDIDYEKEWLMLDFIEYTEPEDGTAGQYYEKQRKILIKPGMGHYQTLSTVYHELGHAVFGLEHIPNTLMESDMRSESYYAENWESLRDNYFTLISK